MPQDDLNVNDSEKGAIDVAAQVRRFNRVNDIKGAASLLTSKIYNIIRASMVSREYDRSAS